MLLTWFASNNNPHDSSNGKLWTLADDLKKTESECTYVVYGSFTCGFVYIKCCFVKL